MRSSTDRFAEIPLWGEMGKPGKHISSSDSAQGPTTPRASHSPSSPKVYEHVITCCWGFPQQRAQAHIHVGSICPAFRGTGVRQGRTSIAKVLACATTVRDCRIHVLILDLMLCCSDTWQLRPLSPCRLSSCCGLRGHTGE